MSIHRFSILPALARPAICALLLSAVCLSAGAQQSPAPTVFGFRDFSAQQKLDAAFLAVPSAELAGQHLKFLTAEPHWASSPEDAKTAQYVAAHFRQAGLQTEIIPFRVLLNKPKSLLIEAFDAQGVRLMSGPTPEHLTPAEGSDPFQNDSRVLPPFNGSSASGDVTAEAVYANFGTLADFDRLAQLGISIKGKIVIVRYGENFRGVKSYIAQQRGALGVLIYSDPADTGYTRGDTWPKGPFLPETGVQRGSVQFIFRHTGDPETPGFASTLDLPDSARLPADKITSQPSIPVNPLSWHDAAPILHALSGPEAPHEWQGGLPFPYHLGGSGVKVHMRLEQDYARRVIWDVIGTIPGTDAPDQWVVVGNHRDAWVYGASDPGSGTAAMLETVHGLGTLLQQGWRPKRTIVVASWDAEEQGLVGSTEWCELNASALAHAAVYLNTDVSVSGPHFNAKSVPSLQQFLRQIATEVPSPAGGTVYDQWRADQSLPAVTAPSVLPAKDVHLSDLGGGSDYTPFLQHLGVPATDISSDGSYAVYHSVFDNYSWFVKYADPTFAYTQQQARIFGLEVLHMADADVLPYDYTAYATAIRGYIGHAQHNAESLKLDFTAAKAASARFTAAAAAARTRQLNFTGDLPLLNRRLRDVETALLEPAGLPNRPFFRHTIYAPGEYTGYAAVVIPGVTEAVSLGNAPRAQAQLAALASALNRAAAILETAVR
ncbi:MAG: M28 family metallopeptidase [Acidobacteriaceae bacterium]|nr:M28 family metallopeptidase [Acidobacteriaceae bacterium]